MKRDKGDHMLKSMPNPLYPKAIDLLMHVGEVYTVPEYIKEAKQWGVSKRIPLDGIPNGIIPNVSRIFLWHSEVIPLIRAEGKTLGSLALKLLEMGLLDLTAIIEYEFDCPWSTSEGYLLPDGYVPPHILRITCIIQAQEPAVRREIEKEFQIEWQGGIFLWSYLGKPQYTVGKDGVVPDEVADKYGDSIDYVQISYDEDESEVTQW
jgi:hypothetical protein